MAFDLQTQLSKFLRELYAGILGGTLPITQVQVGDGASGAPSYSFTSDPDTGIYWVSSGVMNVIANAGAVVRFDSVGLGIGGNDLYLRRAVAGGLAIAGASGTIGSVLKVDSLPTIASGFGTSPSIVAGSTPLAGAVNVGTGGSATSGVINFGGTAFPAAPFVVCTPSLTNVPTRPTTISTTQLTLTTTTAWTASDLVYWVAMSPR